MAKIERTSLVERIRTQLLADLAAGRFGDLMPFGSASITATLSPFSTN